MTRVLLTGANGYIGRNAIRTLVRKGCEVHAVTSRAASSSEPGVAWHRADLLDRDEVERLLKDIAPDSLLHLAWYTEHGNYWTAPENFAWVQASLALMKAFADNGGRRAVIAGTCAEYDWRYGWCSESVTPLSPLTPYGVCKVALGSLAGSLCAVRRISFGWGRIFHSYGPLEPASRFVPSVIRAALAGVPAECSDGAQLRDFLEVTDLADALVTLLLSSVEGPVNIASGMPRTLRQVAEEIARQVGRPDLLRFGAIRPAVGDPPVLLADTRRLFGEVGWRPNLGLEQGIAEAIAWWKGRSG